MSPAAKTPAGSAGFWSATALVVGHTLGVGIFLTPAEVIGGLASPVLTLGLWLACGMMIVAGAFTFGELASRYPFNGGLYIYLREAWGERVAFLYGWQSFLVMDPGVTAALAAGLSEYVVVLWPAADGSQRWIAVAAIWALAAISMVGLTLSTRVVAAMTLGKLFALVAVAIIAFGGGLGSWSHYAPLVARPAGAAPLGEAAAIGLVSVFFSFGGFWEAGRVAGDLDDPARTVPAALAAGVACVTAVYVATTAAFIYLVPASDTTSAAELARRAGNALFGSAGPLMFAWVVVLSVVASMLALLIMAPRLYAAMSRDRQFPSILAPVGPPTPVRPTAILALVASGFALVGTFDQIVAMFMCTTLAFVALAAAALFVVRRRDEGSPPFRSPGYPLTSVVFLVFVLGVVVLVAISRPLQAAVGAGIVILGVPARRLLGPGSKGNLRLQT